MTTIFLGSEFLVPLTLPHNVLYSYGGRSHVFHVALDVVGASRNDRNACMVDF